MNDTCNNLLARRQLWALLREARFGLVTTRSRSGVLTARPLITHNGKGDIGDVLRFFVSSESLWLRDLAGDANLNVAYTAPSGDTCLSISGRGRVVRNVARQKRLWLPAAAAQFPLGPADPALRLLEVGIEVAQLLDTANQLLPLLSLQQRLPASADHVAPRPATQVRGGAAFAHQAHASARG